MSVSIKVVNCREEVDKSTRFYGIYFKKNDCVYLTKMKGSDEIRKGRVSKSKLTVTQCRIKIVSESEVARDEDYNS